MPLQGKETRKSGWIAAAGLRLVLARPAIVVGARTVLLLGLTTSTTGLAVRHLVAPLAATTAMRLVAGDAITGSQLNFQLDDFVLLLIGAITFRH